jgi:bifunctional non-homologous end joining protein LigD
MPRLAPSQPVPPYQAQLALLVDAPPEGDEWLHEQKFDGYRMGLRIDGGTVELWSRRQQDWTAEFPTVIGAGAQLGVTSALLDGEVAAILPSGVTSFQALQNRGAGVALAYFAFDLLHLDGADLRGQPLSERKERLRKLLASGGTRRRPSSGEAGVIRYSDHVVGGGAAFFSSACRLGLEGIVSKLASARYRAGRNADWRKAKCLRRQELVIGGFTDPEGSRDGIGSLLMGYYAAGRLQWAGKVGTGAGWNGRYLRDLRGRLARLQAADSPFDPPIPDAGLRRKAHWVRPELVAEVAFAEWTDDGRVRHGSMQGLREDKPALEVTRERAVQARDAAPAKRAATPAGRAGGKPAAAATNRPPSESGKRRSHDPASDRGAPGARPADGSALVAGVRITHASRVVFGDLGITKADVARYYEAVAERMLPHVVGRPLTLLLCTETIDPGAEKGGCQMMRHGKAWGPAALRRVRIAELHKTGEYLVADTLAALVSLAQMGVVEIHTWNAAFAHPYQHDRIVFDLDPGPQVAWKEVVGAAKLIRRTLAGAGLLSWVKTTGGKGLHVVVPIEPAPAAACLAFARATSETLVAHDAALFTTALPKKGREAKIFIDALRNNRTNTAVAAFSLRARAGAPVSFPLAWTQLTPRLDPAAFDLRAVAAGSARWRDPWHDYWTTHQRLPAT